ncbi:MAG: hypothetical protein ABSG79_12555 [Bryobacteraceae bacterium]
MRLFSAFSKVFGAVGLLVALWGLSTVGQSDRRAWVHSAGGPVRILQFYASAGILTAGETARICYSVENAKSVRISPMFQKVYSLPNYCLETAPEHTTHYTLLAEGYDGAVAMKSFTLQVEAVEPPPPQVLEYAGTALVPLGHEAAHAGELAPSSAGGESGNAACRSRS